MLLELVTSQQVGGHWASWRSFSAPLLLIYCLPLSFPLKWSSAIVVTLDPIKFIAIINKQFSDNREGCVLFQESLYPWLHLANPQPPTVKLHWWMQAPVCSVLASVPPVLCPAAVMLGGPLAAVCSDRIRPLESRYWLGPLGTTLIKIMTTWLGAACSVLCSVLWWSEDAKRLLIFLSHERILRILRRGNVWFLFPLALSFYAS